MSSNLHQADGSHPSAAGTFLTSALLYRAITGRDPEPVNYRLLPGESGGPADELSAIQQS